MVNVKSIVRVLALSGFSVLSMAAVSFAVSQGYQNITNAMSCLCGQLMTILPVVSMLMIIGAGVVYAAGQFLGAETRARANTWATAMLVGAIIGIIITVLAPTILGVLYGKGDALTNATVCDAAKCV